MGFQTLTLAVATHDGHNVTLLEDLTYTTKDTLHVYVAPTGSASDGLSIPKALWNLAPPFGVYWLAGVLHDAAYRGTLQELVGTDLKQASLSKAECDNLFLEAMESLGTPEAIAKMIYEGVHLGGWKAFSEDRKNEENANHRV